MSRNVGGWDGGIRSMRPAQRKMPVTTLLEKLNADNTPAIQNSWLVALPDTGSKARIAQNHESWSTGCRDACSWQYPGSYLQKRRLPGGDLRSI